MASSLGLARVTAAAPASTNAALNVRVVSGPSSLADFAVRAVLPSTATDNPVSLPSTQVVQVKNSTIGDLLASVQQNSTVWAVQVDGIVRAQNSTIGDFLASVQQNSTVWAAQVDGRVRAQNSTVGDFLATVHGNQSSNSSVYLPVRLTNGTAFLQAATDYTHASTVSTVAANLSAPGLMLRGGSDSLSNTNAYTMLRGSTAGSALVSLVTDSGVSAMDSTNGALKVNVVAGSAAGDTTVTASFAAGYVSTAAPAAGSSGLVVRQVGYSTTINVSSLAGPVIVRSSAADALQTVYQSSAADLNVTVAGYSTTVNVSSLAGAVIVRSSAADAIVTVKNSTIGDLLASVQQNSTVWQTQAALRTSSGGSVEGSTTVPAQSVLGVHVREVPSSMQTVSASTVGATSTGTTLISSAAGAAPKIFAFSVTSTVAAASTVSFRSSNATVLWPLVLGSQSSGITGANLAVAPPAYLFAVTAANALVFHTPSSGAEFHVAVSYFL